MSDVWFNLRIWVYHIQAGRKQWWNFEISRNDWHLGNKESPLIELYEIGFPKSYKGGRAAQGNSK